MNQGKANSRQVVSFYWHQAWRYPRWVLGTLITVPLVIILNTYLPALILANVLTRLSRGDFLPHRVWASFGHELVTYALLVGLSGTLGWRTVDHFAWKLEGNVERNIAQRVFRHLLSQSADFHANNFTGSLVSQTTKLMSSYIRVADTTVFQMTPLITGLIVAPVILAFRAPLFSIILIVFAVLYIISALLVTATTLRHSGRLAAAESQQTGALADAVTNVMAVKSFARGDYEKRRFAGATDFTFSRLQIFIRAHRRQHNFFGTASSLISALSLTMAVVSVVSFNANIGTVFLILNYTASIVSQLFQFSNNTLRNYSRAVGDAGDMVRILGIEPEVKDPVKPEKLRIHDGQISFRNVNFTHSGSDDALFEDLSLDIAAGEKVGLVGHSGSGKTTFTRVLLRFSDIDNGEILIDGQNIAHLRQDDLHSQIAYVPQEPLLFHRTIRENIAYGRPDASDAEVIDSARKAHAEEFIDTLPQGYETLVGERGVKLSGGQRQRIAIARAMLKNAPILVLDEATSALDSESEVLIQDALWKLMQGRTAIVIAHRLSTVQKMDRIIVLDDGKISEQGSHKQLLKNKNTYAKLWAHQSGGFMED